jgi:uncharacterized protein (TIGR02996 family)
MNEDAAFVRSLLDNPSDALTRLVYADWLEEQGDPASTVRAEFLRTEDEWAALPESDERRLSLQARLQELAGAIDSGWLAVVARTPLENCSVRFAYACPLRWDNLTPTADRNVRFCSACEQHVHYCATLAEAQHHAWSGECVAIDTRVAREPGDLELPMVTLGVLIDPHELSLEPHRPPRPLSPRSRRRRRSDQDTGQP